MVLRSAVDAGGRSFLFDDISNFVDAPIVPAGEFGGLGGLGGIAIAIGAMVGPAVTSQACQGSRSIEDVTLTQADLPRALLGTEQHRSINGCIAFIASLDYDVSRGNAVSP
jgi:hypothetical protein